MSGWDTFRLALGAWLTSPGFGGLAALIAAVIAYLGITKRIAADHDLAIEAADRSRAAADAADERQRWWEVLQWTWTNRDALEDRDPLIAASVLEALEPLVQTAAQSVILDATSRAIVDPAAEDPEVGGGHGGT